MQKSICRHIEKGELGLVTGHIKKKVKVYKLVVNEKIVNYTVTSLGPTWYKGTMSSSACMLRFFQCLHPLVKISIILKIDITTPRPFF